MARPRQSGGGRDPIDFEHARCRDRFDLGNTKVTDAAREALRAEFPAAPRVFVDAAAPRSATPVQPIYPSSILAVRSKFARWNVQ